MVVVVVVVFEIMVTCECLKNKHRDKKLSLLYTDWSDVHMLDLSSKMKTPTQINKWIIMIIFHLKNSEKNYQSG